MKKNSFVFISDALLVTGLAFLAAMAVSRYYLKKFTPSLIVAICAGAIAFAIFSVVNGRKNALAREKGKRAEFAEKLRYALAFTPESEYPSLTERLKPLSDGKTPVCEFGLRPLSADDVVGLCKKADSDSVAVFAAEFQEDARSLAENSGGRIKLVPLPEFVSLFDETDEILSRGFVPEKRKIGLKRLFYASLKPKAARKFALYGLLLILSGRFSFYPLPYILSGCAFALYSAAALIFGRRA